MKGWLNKTFIMHALYEKKKNVFNFVLSVISVLYSIYYAWFLLKKKNVLNFGLAVMSVL